MKRIARLFALFVTSCLTLSAGSAFGDYKDGLRMAQKGQWQKAIAEFRDLAKTGHAPSQFSLGLIYHLGRGTPVNHKKAYDLYQQSALQEHPSAINNIGMMYLRGEYVTKNENIAFRLFEKASADHSQAKDNLGQCYENGWGVEADNEQAMNFYQLAGDEGFKLGYFHLGQLHEEGRGDAPVNIEEAITWYQAAGDAQYARGFHRIGEIYEQGISMPADKDKAVYWYQQAADLDYEPALAKIAQLK